VHRPSWLWLAIWLGAQLGIPLCAAAQTVHGAARVNTLVDACVPIDVEQFHRVLAIELGTSIEYAPTAAQQPDGAVVRVVCAFGNAVQLQLEDNLTRKSMQRVVELPLIEVATRTRLLALSVAEFVVASWVELRLAQAPLPAAGPPVNEAAKQQARRMASARLPAATPSEQSPPPEAHSSAQGPRWLLGLSFEPVLFSGGSGLLPQLSLHLQQRPNEHFVLSLALSLGYAHWRVRWPTLDVGAAAITTSSGRLTFGYVEQVGMLELSVGAGARGGVVHMAGWSNSSILFADQIYAPWGGPLVQLVAAGLAGPFRISVELEAGYVTLPAEGLIKLDCSPRTECAAPIKGAVVAQLQGFWGSLGLGIGLLF
jgi:hypothetical protein